MGKRPWLTKKWILAIVLLLAVLVSACAAPGSDEGFVSLPEAASVADAPAAGAEIALITTGSRLDDAFGQAVWSTMSKFAGEAGFTSGSYKAEEGDASAALATLELAQMAGARLVVAMDATVTKAISESLAQYSGTDFVLLDAPEGLAPRANTAIVRFSPEQAGFLAGYVAAYEQPDLLAFVQQEDEVSRRYALGFLLGAETAAEEQECPPGGLRVIDLSLKADTGEAEAQEQIEDVYAEGARLVFSAGSGRQEELLKAAQLSGGKMIGVGLPLGTTGAAALASVEFDPRHIVQTLLEGWRDGAFPGGQELVGQVEDGDVQLSVAAERFENVREWILSQAPLRFEDGRLADRLAALTQPDEDGNLPSAGEMEWTYLTVLPPGALALLNSQGPGALTQPEVDGGQSGTESTPDAPNSASSTAPEPL